MSGKNMPSADNQQETLFYYSGFLTGEGSISIIKAKDRKGFYFTPDITISNADLSLLKELNLIIAGNRGVISKIKGGYNLSQRGKNKVNILLSFLEKYPPLAGDIIREKLYLLGKSIVILSQKKSARRRMKFEEAKIEKIRFRLKELKKGSKPRKIRIRRILNDNCIGYFLAGIIDAEGSMGLKKSGNRLQPFFSVAMKEEAVINLIQNYCGFGNIYYRPISNLWHFETAKRANVLKLCEIFWKQYPLKLKKNQLRLMKLQRILNDYTPDSLRIEKGNDIV